MNANGLSESKSLHRLLSSDTGATIVFTGKWTQRSTSQSLKESTTFVLDASHLADEMLVEIQESPLCVLPPCRTSFSAL
jgi:hypothetical protein